MEHLQPREMADLHPAALAIGQDDLGFDPLDGFCQVFTDFLGDIVFLLLKAEHSAQTATMGLDVFNRQAWNEPEDIKGGETNSKGLEMAGSKIGCFQGKLFKVRIEGSRFP